MEMIEKIRSSFTTQAGAFESDRMSFSKKEYLDYTVKLMNLSASDCVLEVAAGTCACGRSIAPLVERVVCLDATDAMLDVGRREAAAAGLGNMEFVNGLAEEIPYADGTFDAVLSRLAFHHFAEVGRPFAEQARVLKKGGKLILIDMEAAREDLREVEDRLETVRDFSHVRNVSVAEFEALYAAHGIRLVEKQLTRIAVSLAAWMDLTQVSEAGRAEIRAAMEAELAGGPETGFQPFLKDGAIYFQQRWVIFIGTK